MQLSDKGMAPAEIAVSRRPGPKEVHPVIEQRIPQPKTTNTGETHTAEDARHSLRQSRGAALATNYFHEIRKVSPGCYSVPASKPSEAYLVSVCPVAQCSCPDFDHRVRGAEACKHIHAVRYLVKKSSTCDGCGERHYNRDLFEVVDSLTYFEGDMLCVDCLHSSDAEVL